VEIESGYPDYWRRSRDSTGFHVERGRRGDVAHLRNLLNWLYLFAWGEGRGQLGQAADGPGQLRGGGEELLQGEGRAQDESVSRAGAADLEPERGPCVVQPAGEDGQRVGREGEPIGEREPVEVGAEGLPVNVGWVELLYGEWRDRGSKADQEVNLVEQA